MYEKHILDSGLKIIMHKMPQVRSVSVVFFIAAGGCYETAEQSGMSHFIEHMCFKGTRERPTTREITEAIEGTGGMINGGTDKELTVYWSRVAGKHLRLALDVLTDIVRFSRFDSEDIDKERRVILEEINMNYDSPQQRADTLLYDLMWPGQPVGRDVAGFKHTVQSFSRLDMYDFYVNHYVPAGMVVSIAGDMDSREVLDILDEKCLGWENTRCVKRLHSISLQGEPRIKMEYRDIEQVQLSLGFHGLSLLSPDRFAVDLLNVILGDGMSSRLFLEVREKYGLAYDIGSGVDHYLDAGDIMVHSGLEPEHMGEAMEVIMQQLSVIRSNVLEHELARAKELVKGRMFLAMESPHGVANWYGAQEILTGKILDVDAIASLVDAVTVNDLHRVAGELIREEKVNLVVVGPLKEENDLRRILKL